jgi:hypothetical protein
MRVTLMSLSHIGQDRGAITAATTSAPGSAACRSGRQAALACAAGVRAVLATPGGSWAVSGARDVEPLSLGLRG